MRLRMFIGLITLCVCGGILIGAELVPEPPKLVRFDLGGRITRTAIDKPETLKNFYSFTIGSIEAEVRPGAEGDGTKLISISPLKPEKLSKSLSKELADLDAAVKQGRTVPKYTGIMAKFNELNRSLIGLEQTAAIMVPKDGIISKKQKEIEWDLFSDKIKDVDSKVALLSSGVAIDMVAVRSNSLEGMKSFCNFDGMDTVSFFNKVILYLSTISSLFDSRDMFNTYLGYALKGQVPFEYSLTCSMFLYRLLVVVLQIIKKVNDDFGGVSARRERGAVAFNTWKALVNLRGVAIIRDSLVLLGDLQKKKNLWKTSQELSKDLSYDQKTIKNNLNQRFSVLNKKISDECAKSDVIWRRLASLPVVTGRRGSL
ncbi:hypothetical protein KAT92_01830 [Candidatus Babeliales bacterium]|nr:hypothetical protein [Candidatus Babeliales bacterium]